ncbi:hypothetical protein SAMN04488548_10537 [Gordonia westfalica]|uniref:Uncharacterized protein n=1 Tax=Gordonia westfalica TaxID=158898 RepID=A0A1H2DMI5_9ACTN|nr:hypothetical protein SAMN04488548_10537 [Gordonia westfalica]
MPDYKGPLDYVDVATRIVEFRNQHPTAPSGVRRRGGRLSLSRRTAERSVRRALGGATRERAVAAQSAAGGDSTRLTPIPRKGSHTIHP